MTVTLKEMMEKLPAKERKATEARAAQLIAEFPVRPPVSLTGVAAIENEKPWQGRRPARSSQKAKG